MYAHLEVKSRVPVIATGYRLHSKITFAYGDISIEAEVAFPENETTGTIVINLFRDDKASVLPGGELPEETTELELLSKILPVKDIAYLLALLGMYIPGDVYKDRRRARVETPKARKFKFYERLELLYFQSVDEEWLQLHGALFGYGNNKRK